MPASTSPVNVPKRLRVCARLKIGRTGVLRRTETRPDSGASSWSVSPRGHGSVSKLSHALSRLNRVRALFETRNHSVDRAAGKPCGKSPSSTRAPCHRLVSARTAYRAASPNRSSILGSSDGTEVDCRPSQVIAKQSRPGSNTGCWNQPRIRSQTERLRRPRHRRRCNRRAPLLRRPRRSIRSSRASRADCPLRPPSRWRR